MFPRTSFRSVASSPTTISGQFLRRPLPRLLHFSSPRARTCDPRQVAARTPESSGGGALTQAIAYAGLDLVFVLVIFAAGDGQPRDDHDDRDLRARDPRMARQSVILRDDAKARQARPWTRGGALRPRRSGIASDVIMISSMPMRQHRVSLRLRSSARFGLWHERPRRPPARPISRARPIATGSPQLPRRGHRRPRASRSGPGRAVGRHFVAALHPGCVGSNLLDDPAVARPARSTSATSASARRSRSSLRQLAFHDPLTLLANRSLFRNRVRARARRWRSARGSASAVHVSRPRQLQERQRLARPRRRRPAAAGSGAAARQVRRAPSDTVARLGGRRVRDPARGHSTSRQDVEQIASDDHATRSTQPLAIDGSDLLVTTSIGVAPVAARRRHRAPAAQRRHRDVQREGRRQGAASSCSSRACRSSCASGCASRRTSTAALERDEFFLEFQPVVDLTDAELLGVEALVRWKHPSTGIVMPGAVHPDRRGDPARSSSSAAGCSTMPAARVRDWRELGRRGRGPARRGEHLRPPPAAGRPGGGRARALEISGLEPENLRHRADREHDHAQHRGATSSASAS